MSDPGPHLAAILPQFTEIRARFLQAFARALPEADAATLSFRMHCTLGVICHTMLNLDRLDVLTFGEARLDDDEDLLRRLVRYTAGGLRAALLALLCLLPCLATACTVDSPPRNAARMVEDITPARWQQERALETSEPQLAWWLSFGDEELNAHIREALTKNRDLYAAASRIDAAAIQARLAGASLLPTLDASLDGSRQRQNFIGLPIPGSSGVLSTTVTQWGASLSASWEIDLWGRIRAGKRAALADFDAAYDEACGTRLSTAGQVCKAWFALVEARRQREVALENVKSFRATYDVVRQRFDAGRRPALDLRLAETQLRSAEANVARREAQLEALSRSLEILLGRYPKGKLRSRGELPSVTERVPVGLPMALLSRRPDLRAAERRVVAGLERRDEARAALYPRISLVGSAGTRTQDIEDLIDPDFFVWNLAGNLLAPIFRGGQLRGNIALTEARTREALANFSQACLRAYSEVESGLASEAALDRELSSLSAAETQARASVTLARERYRSGLGDFTSVLEAQRSTLDLSSRVLSARRARLDARIDLYLALGGGFREDAPFLPTVSRSESERARKESEQR